MKYFAGLLATIGLISAVGISGVRAADTKGTEDLHKLVHANLEEVVNLRAEMPSLAGHRKVQRVWRSMIRDHQSGAWMLARLDRKWGGHPNMSMPDAHPATGSVDDIVAQTLRDHKDTLDKVRGMKDGASNRELRALNDVEGIVKNHIMMIEALRPNMAH